MGTDFCRGIKPCLQTRLRHLSYFRQVACNQRGRNASQLNIGGTGLGSFNDRFRDALMGGSPFASPRYQGFVSGLHTSPNSFMQARSQHVFDSESK